MIISIIVITRIGSSWKRGTRAEACKKRCEAFSNELLKDVADAVDKNGETAEDLW